MVSTFQWNLCGIAWFQHLGGCQSMGFNGGSTVARLSSVIYQSINQSDFIITRKLRPAHVGLWDIDTNNIIQALIDAESVTTLQGLAPSSTCYGAWSNRYMSSPQLKHRVHVNITELCFSLLTPGCINNQLLRKWWAYHSWAGSCLPLPYPRNWRLLLLLLYSLGDLRHFHSLVQRLTRWLLTKGQWDALRLLHSTTDIQNFKLRVTSV